MTSEKDIVQKGHQLGWNRTRVLVEAYGKPYQGPCPKRCGGWVYCNDEGCACDTCGWIPSK